MSEIPQGAAAMLMAATLAGNAPDGHLLEVRYGKRGEGMRQRFVQVGDYRAAAAFGMAAAGSGDAYISALPRLRQSGTLDGVEATWVLWTDIDQDDGVERAARFEPAPSIIVETGTAGHALAIWQLSSPLGADQVKPMNLRLAHALGGDLAASDGARVLRMPGTLNHKDDKPRPVRWVQLDPHGYSVERLVGHLPDPPAPRPPRIRSATVDEPLDDVLLEIWPSVYVPTLTGQDIGRDRKVRCPFHSDGQERTPSLHAWDDPQDGWYCFACERGGTIIDLGAELYGVEPRGQWLPRDTAAARYRPSRGHAMSGISVDQRERLAELAGGESTPGTPVIYSIADLAALPEPTWLIDEILPSGGFGVLFGPSGCGKSFLALDWALCVSSGLAWYGQETHRGPVLYIAAEGSSGLHKRVATWLMERRQDPPDAIRFLPIAVNLLEDIGIRTVQAAMSMMSAPPSLVVVDTIARCMVGGDENTTRDMGRFIHAIDTLRRGCGAAGLCVHHTGKDGEDERGSSALRGAADAMIALKPDGAGARLSCIKQKDAPEFDDWKLHLQTVGLSCMMRLGASETSLSPSEVKVLRGVRESFGTSWVSPSTLQAELGVAKASFYRSLKALVDRGLLNRDGDDRRSRYVLTPKGDEHVVSLGLSGSMTLGQGGLTGLSLLRDRETETNLEKNADDVGHLVANDDPFIADVLRRHRGRAMTALSQTLLVAIGRAVQRDGGDMDDVGGLVVVCRRLGADAHGRVARMRYEATRPRCRCADEPQLGADDRCTRCFGWRLSHPPGEHA